MSRPMRIAIFGASLLAVWLILILLVAGVRWNMPLHGEHRVFHGSRFQQVFGEAEPNGQDLRVDAAGADFSALQTAQVPDLDAQHFPILSYRFDDFPRTLELSLVFRRAGSKDVESISLPRPTADGAVSVDLSGVAAWHGEISEIGFAQFPVAQLVPPQQAFRPFTLRSATLRSASWFGQVDTLLSAWFAHTPWQLVSISALGPSEIGDSTPHPLRPPLVAAIALALAAVLAWVVLGLRGRAWRRLLAIGVGVAWLALDLCWLRDLDYKRRTDQDAWGNIALAQRQQHVADGDLSAAALALKKILRDEPPDRHVLLGSLSPFVSIRLAYHAAPLNIGLAVAPPAGGLPAGTIIVRYDMPAAFNNGMLGFGGQQFPAEPVEEGEHLAIYRVLGAMR